MRVCTSGGQVIISITGGAAAFDLPTTYKDVVMKGPLARAKPSTLSPIPKT
jgi:hypothetical protein